MQAAREEPIEHIRRSSDLHALGHAELVAVGVNAIAEVLVERAHVSPREASELIAASARNYTHNGGWNANSAGQAGVVDPLRGSHRVGLYPRQTHNALRLIGRYAAVFGLADFLRVGPLDLATRAQPETSITHTSGCGPTDD